MQETILASERDFIVLCDDNSYVISRDFLYFENTSKNKLAADVYDCFGNLVKNICTDESLIKIGVPAGDSLKLKKRA